MFPEHSAREEGGVEGGSNYGSGEGRMRELRYSRAARVKGDGMKTCRMVVTSESLHLVNLIDLSVVLFTSSPTFSY